MVSVLTLLFLSILTINLILATDTSSTEILSNHLQSSRLGTFLLINGDGVTSVQASGVCVAAAGQNMCRLMHDLAEETSAVSGSNVTHLRVRREDSVAFV